MNKKSEHIGTVTGNYHMCLLIYVEEGVLGKVSTSVCTYMRMKSQRAPLVPFHLEVKRDKTVKATDFFFTVRGGRE